MVVDKIMVCGGRDFNNEAMLFHALDELLLSLQSHETKCYTLIAGAARGADTLAAVYAKNNNLKLEEYPAEWDKYGKSAGYRRNTDMVDASDMVVAFWDGKSKGTKHSIDLALSKGKHLLVIHYE